RCQEPLPAEARRGGRCQRGGAGREPEVGRGLRRSRRRRHSRTAHGVAADLRVFLADMLQFLLSAWIYSWQRGGNVSGSEL
ncbi:hypothetical protein EI555_009418, partial [Monodon monoceros]